MCCKNTTIYKKNNLLIKKHVFYQMNNIISQELNKTNIRKNNEKQSN